MNQAESQKISEVIKNLDKTREVLSKDLSKFMNDNGKKSIKKQIGNIIFGKTESDNINYNQTGFILPTIKLSLLNEISYWKDQLIKTNVKEEKEKKQEHINELADDFSKFDSIVKIDCANRTIKVLDQTIKYTVDDKGKIEFTYNGQSTSFVIALENAKGNDKKNKQVPKPPITPIVKPAPTVTVMVPQSELEKVQIENRDLKEKLKEKDGELAKEQEEKTKLLEKIVQLEKEKKEEAQKIADLTLANVGLTTKVTELETQNTEMLEQITNLGNENTQLTEQLADSNLRITELETQNTEMKEQMTNISNENAQSRTDLDAANQGIKDLNERMAKLEAIFQQMPNPPVVNGNGNFDYDAWFRTLPVVQQPTVQNSLTSKPTQFQGPVISSSSLVNQTSNQVESVTVATDITNIVSTNPPISNISEVKEGLSKEDLQTIMTQIYEQAGININSNEFGKTDNEQIKWAFATMYEQLQKDPRFARIIEEVDYRRQMWAMYDRQNGNYDQTENIGNGLIPTYEYTDTDTFWLQTGEALRQVVNIEFQKQGIGKITYEGIIKAMKEEGEDGEETMNVEAD